jgi:hypothetical protein
MMDLKKLFSLKVSEQEAIELVEKAKRLKREKTVFQKRLDLALIVIGIPLVVFLNYHFITNVPKIKVYENPHFGRNKYIKPIYNARQTQTQFDTKVTSFKLQVTGTEEFKTRIALALTLIQEKNPKIYDMIRQYIYVINHSTKTGFKSIENVPTVFLSNESAFKSVTWCASELARGAFMAKDYYQRLRGIHDPQSQTMTINERADKFQMNFLKAIGAPPSEIEMVTTVSRPLL